MVAPRAPLPTAGPAFVGRAADVSALAALLDGRGPRLVTLTGPPGVGKTRLALAVAEAVAPQHSDGVVWVDLAPVRAPDRLLGEVAHAAGATTHAAGTDHDGLVLALAGRDLLLVLDNCEHLVGAAPAIGHLVTALPRLRVLATSRERLRLLAEHEHRVTPLAVPDGVVDPGRLADNPAVALLLHHAPPSVAVTPASAQALVDICVQLDGLPLALEFAAARLRVFTPGELAFRLRHPVRELVGGARDGPPRHRDLRSAIVWSHDLLGEDERAVFRRASVFAGAWTVDAAEAVCGGPDVPDVTSALLSLLDKSLLRRAEGDAATRARFSMMVSLREYAAEQLAEHGERAAARAAHATWAGRVAREWESTLGDEDENRWWPEVTAQRADLELGLETARAAGDQETERWIAAALGWCCYICGSPGLARAVVDLADRDVDRDATATHTATQLAAGVVAFALGDLTGAEHRLRRAAAACTRSADVRRLAVASAFLGHVARERGDHDQAAAHYGAALAVYDEAGNTRGTAWAHCDLGLLAAGLGHAAEAEAELERALVVFESLDYPWATAVAAGALGGVMQSVGRTDAAAALLGRALRLHEAVGDRRGTASALEGLAEVALDRGAAVTAARLLGAASDERRAVGARASGIEADRVHRVTAGVRQDLGAVDAERQLRRGQGAPPAVVLALADRVLGGDAVDATTDARLTARQREVAALVAAGRTNRQIARSLAISEKTVELHVRGAMERLGVPNRAGVAAWVGGHARDVPPG